MEDLGVGSVGCLGGLIFSVGCLRCGDSVAEGDGRDNQGVP